jgi:hypothetical protein
MSYVEKSTMDVFIEGIRARTRGDAISANPYPFGARDHGVWLEGWRILLERLARGDLH